MAMQKTEPQSALMLSETQNGVGAQQLMVTCMIGPQQYGLPIEAVREVVRLPDLLTLVGAPPYFCGLLNLRGSYVSILDGRVLMSETPRYALSNQIIIAGHTQASIGLLVDEVLDVYPADLARMTPIGHHAAASFLHGVVTVQDTSVILFDIEALLALVPRDL